MKCSVLMYYSYTVLLIALMSCQRSEVEFIELQKKQAISANEDLIMFPDKRPVNLFLKDSIVYVINKYSDTCMSAYNIFEKKLLKNFGVVGRGPQDLMGPWFILSSNNSEVIIEDVNLKKILKITPNFTFEKYIEYPQVIFPSSEINLSKNFIVGRKIGRESKMFYIYDYRNDKLVDIDYYPTIKGLDESSANHSYAPCFALNESKGKIVIGMCFLDMFQIYDLKGNRLKSVSFSKKYIPNISEHNSGFDLENSYSAIPFAFPTDEFCYLYRIVHIPEKNKEEKMLIRIDWEGNLLNTYALPDDIDGRFYIDDKTSTLYAIRQTNNIISGEMYYITDYKLK